MVKLPSSILSLSLSLAPLLLVNLPPHITSQHMVRKFDNLRDDSLWVTSDRDVCEALRWAAENSCGPVGRVGR